MRQKNIANISYVERKEIEYLINKGYRGRAIAQIMQRSKSAIYQELQRTTPYRAHLAQQYARTLLKDRKYQTHHIERVPALKQFVVDALRSGWSPDVIAGYMKKERLPFFVSKTAIYDWLYSAWGQPYCRYLHSSRYGRRKRKERHPPRVMIPFRIGIEQRNAGATNRSQYGHWEADTIVSARGGSGALLTTQERKSRYITITKSASLSAYEVAWHLQRHVRRLRVKSMTFDNGIENKRHYTVGVPTFFCDAYCSWQKGGIENANRLIRRFIPKKTDMQYITQQYCDAIADAINKKPRKILGYASPYEVAIRNHLFKSQSVRIQG